MSTTNTRRRNGRRKRAQSFVPMSSAPAVILRRPGTDIPETDLPLPKLVFSILFLVALEIPVIYAAYYGYREVINWMAILFGTLALFLAYPFFSLTIILLDELEYKFRYTFARKAEPFEFLEGELDDIDDTGPVKVKRMDTDVRRNARFPIAEAYTI